MVKFVKIIRGAVVSAILTAVYTILAKQTVFHLLTESGVAHTRGLHTDCAQSMDPMRFFWNPLEPGFV